MAEGNYPIEYILHHQGKWSSEVGEVITETPVSLSVNGEVWLTFMCTPVDLEVMAAGF